MSSTDRANSTRLQHAGWRQLSLEDPVPEPAGDTKSVLIVGKVMLEMVPLQLAIVRWKTICRWSEKLKNAKETEKAETYFRWWRK